MKAILEQLVIEPCTGKLSAANKKTLLDYSKAVAEFAEKLDTLQDRHAALLEQGESLTLATILETGDSLVDEKADLTQELIELAWRRLVVVSELVPDYEKAVVDAQAAYEDAIAKETERFAKEGVTVRAMPAGDTAAGHIQLRQRVEQELPVLAAKQQVFAAEEALTQVRGPFGTPNRRGMKLVWPSVASRLATKITVVAELERVVPAKPLPSVPAYEGALQELAYDGETLSEPIREVITDIAAACGDRGGMRPIIKTASRDKRKSSVLLALLAKLPNSPAVVELRGTMKSLKGDASEARSHGRTTLVV